jgi:DNA-directed RNA polymerase III subunit RPC3
MQETVTANVCRALTNIRLRRQHEVEVGKAWIERSKEKEVNEHEMDKENYNKFCQGLERLDNAALQLYETLMVLLDF